MFPRNRRGKPSPEGVVAESYFGMAAASSAGINGLISSYSSASLHDRPATSIPHVTNISAALSSGCQIYSMGWDYPEKETVTDMVKAYVNCQKKTKVYYYNKITQDNRQFEENARVLPRKCRPPTLKWSISHK